MDWSKKLTPVIKGIYTLNGTNSYYDSVDLDRKTDDKINAKYTATIKSDVTFPENHYLRSFISENPSKVLDKIAKKITPNSPAAGLTGLIAGAYIGASIGGPAGALVGAGLGPYLANKMYATKIQPIKGPVRKDGIVYAKYNFKEKKGWFGLEALEQGYNRVPEKFPLKPVNGKMPKYRRLKQFCNGLSALWNAEKYIPADQLINRSLETYIDADNGDIGIVYRTETPDGRIKRVPANVIRKDMNRIVAGVKRATVWERLKYRISPHWQEHGFWATIKKVNADYQARRCAEAEAAKSKKETKKTTTA